MAQHEEHTTHSQAFYIAIGVVLLVWGGMGALSSQRGRRQGRVDNVGGMS